MMSTISKAEEALKWYKETFTQDCPDFKLSIITADFSGKKFWFADATIQCHAGNLYRPVVTMNGETYNIRETSPRVAVGQAVACSVVEGARGLRAYRWVTMESLLDAYAKLDVK